MRARAPRPALPSLYPPSPRASSPPPPPPLPIPPTPLPPPRRARMPLPARSSSARPGRAPAAAAARPALLSHGAEANTESEWGWAAGRGVGRALRSPAARGVGVAAGRVGPGRAAAQRGLLRGRRGPGRCGARLSWSWGGKRVAPVGLLAVSGLFTFLKAPPPPSPSQCFKLSLIKHLRYFPSVGLWSTGWKATLC